MSFKRIYYGDSICIYHIYHSIVLYLLVYGETFSILSVSTFLENFIKRIEKEFIKKNVILDVIYHDYS